MNVIFIVWFWSWFGLLITVVISNFSTLDKDNKSINKLLFQWSTLDYIQSDLNQSTNQKTATGKDCQQPISQGQFHTIFSRAKRRDRLFLLNLDLEDVKINSSALEEIFWMRQQSLFSCEHPLIELKGTIICFFNTRSRNKQSLIF